MDRLSGIFVLNLLHAVFAPSYQLSDLNCIRTNPGVLDADFSVLNRYEDIANVTKEDIAERDFLFSTRFNRAHDFKNINLDASELYGEGVSLLSKKNIELFLTTNYPTDISDASDAIRVYREDYEFIKRMQSGNESKIVGLYVHNIHHNFREDLEAVQSVFGSKKNPNLSLGILARDCLEMFQNRKANRFLQRLDFINCVIMPRNKHSIQETADAVMQTCLEIREGAKSSNLSVEIMCTIAFQSKGISRTEVVGSVVDFQKFWCRIVSKIIEGMCYPKIVMWSAFDYAPGSNQDGIFEMEYHTGWWRRSHADILEGYSYVEKVDELNGGSSTMYPSTDSPTTLRQTTLHPKTLYPKVLHPTNFHSTILPPTNLSCKFTTKSLFYFWILVLISVVEIFAFF